MVKPRQAMWSGRVAVLVVVVLAGSCTARSEGGDPTTTVPTTIPAPTTTAATSTTTGATTTSTLPEETTTTGSPIPPADVADAEAAALDLLTAMREGRYDDALKLYAGPYDELANWNEDLDPTDHRALLERACERQLTCEWEVRSIEFEMVRGDGTLVFLVEYEDADGQLVTRWNPAVDSMISRFPFWVIRVGDVYRAYHLPQYPG
jgi:hypothetical protein